MAFLSTVFPGTVGWTQTPALHKLPEEAAVANILRPVWLALQHSLLPISTLSGAAFSPASVAPSVRFHSTVRGAGR